MDWKRGVRMVSGVSLVLAGVAMLVLPGPGVVAVVGGLALLERDLPAAGRLAGWVRGWIPALPGPQR